LAPAIAGVAAIALGAPFFWPLSFIAAGAVAAIASLAFLEALLLRRVRISLARAPTVAISLGEEEMVRASIAHDAAFSLKVALRIRLPPELGGGSRTLRGLCGPGEQLHLEHPVAAIARAEATIAPGHVGVMRWGFIERILEAGSPQVVRVFPNLKSVGRLHALLNAFFLRGLGTRMAPRVGQGREFDRLRDYVAGDDFRQIAWKASARLRKPIVKEFHVERSQDVLICVDRGHRMARRVGPLTRADHAVNAAVLVSYICNRAEDRTGLLAFADEVDLGVAQGRGAAHLAAITQFSTGIMPEFLHSDYRALAGHLRRRLRSRTLVLMFTVLPERVEQDQLLSATHMLMPRHLPLVLVLKDADLEAAAQALPQDRAELCRALVASELVQGRQRLMRELRHLGAIVVETLPEQSGFAAVNAYLDVKRRQLL
jgi:uncharacterized protein (DUF58 family)